MPRAASRVRHEGYVAVGAAYPSYAFGKPSLGGRGYRCRHPAEGWQSTPNIGQNHQLLRTSRGRVRRGCLSSRGVMTSGLKAPKCSERTTQRRQGPWMPKTDYRSNLKVNLSADYHDWHIASGRINICKEKMREKKEEKE